MKNVVWRNPAHAADGATTCVGFWLDPSRFLQMMKTEGAVETATKLFMVPTYHEGLTKLWELGRLDLTLKAIIIRNFVVTYFQRKFSRQLKKSLNN